MKRSAPAAILPPMIRLRANRLTAIAGRLLLAAALVLANGAWGEVLAATLSGACPHATTHLHAGDAGAGDCCVKTGGGADCSKHGAACTGACLAVCGPGWPAGVPVAASMPAPALPAATPGLRAVSAAPSPALSPALRPPISA